ncbi:MAG: pyridoxal-phosphate dependent enzyme, partial [Gemmatimonadetes bacterium]|nr:pyridoxal-phosphate dependent enzyme [Gemmatimonadota bacterium]NIR81547.1 pyridoxal-phosphate dependent enzyme [Gemmatimonadota bacterium]NIT90388.1 pyridoxal-phosphate dependent enzyme [Gemmatimonadota bacterium]NIU34216.1 pyridoxal-phosphate dependent enzyme [Gemmatimonadota bacterium]NIU38360.1 pyridoxal-phosphate dependent enzyme [Gemmatimonadota bacterium]
WDDLPRLDLETARHAVDSVAVRTPLLPCPSTGDRLGRPVHLKLESLQVTGSFKVRGAAARIARLGPDERARGVVACSSGNHGRAVAHVAGRAGIPATICVPDWVDPVKREAIEAEEARIVLAGATYDAAEERAERFRDEEGLTVVHPFDDPWVVAGQATVGREIVADLPDLGAVVIPLSGGGLAGGVAYAVKAARPEVTTVAVSAERARVMVESLRAGAPVEMEETDTLASALAGGIGLDNRVTLPLIRALVDAHVLVGEEEIAGTMLHAHRHLHLVVEGGGAVGLAALLGGRLDEALAGAPRDAPVVVIVSGGNVGLGTLARIAEERAGRNDTSSG